jgi:dihydrofolate synthase/folylpolyglutamate synthase
VADRALSDNVLVQRQLDRLDRLSPGIDALGLERIGALMEKLDHPERSLPPVFHIAGTNGKGSTCAFLRAAVEAAGLTAHVYTSPHLVRFNERIRIAGALIDDDLLAALLSEVLDTAGDVHPTFFEVTTAAALLAFARHPADACIVEVGLGGRLDATNIIPQPAVCGIAQLAIDHQAMLGESLELIAVEKAGIAKRGVPLVTQNYPARVAGRIGDVAANAGAIWLPRGDAWNSTVYQRQLHYRDHRGKLDLPLPRLSGAHQSTNAALAIAMLRHQHSIHIPEAAMRAAMGWAEWPARLQQLSAGPLHAMLPPGAQLWLDGGHNPAAARAIADFFRGHVAAAQPFHIILGLLDNKDPLGIMKPFRNRSITVHAIPVADHAHHAPAKLAAVAREAGLNAMPAAGIEDALGWIARHADRSQPPVVLILGSLYLAGEILRKNQQPPA